MKPKVMILITGLGVGGAEHFLSRVLPKIRNCEITVVAMLGIKDLEQPLLDSGITVRYLNEGKRFRPFRTIFRFFRIVRKVKPRLLVTFLLPADLFGRLFGRLFGIKRVCSSVRNDYTHMSPGLAKWERRTSWLVDLYLPNSEGLRPYLEKKQGIAKRKIEVLPITIDIDAQYANAHSRDNLRTELGLAENVSLVVNVARLKPQKDQLTLLQAFAQLDSEAVLLMVGDDEFRREGEQSYRGVLEEEVKRLGIAEQVVFLGSRRDVASILYQSDIFVLPSKTEGMSNALLEAMTLGLPSIVSDIAQNTAVISHEQTGLVFKQGDPDALCEALDRLLHEKGLRKRLGRAAQEEVKEQYALDSVVRKFEKVLGVGK